MGDYLKILILISNLEFDFTMDDKIHLDQYLH